MFSVLGVVLALLCGGQIAWHGYSAQLLPAPNAHYRTIGTGAAVALLVQRKIESSQKISSTINSISEEIELEINLSSPEVASIPRPTQEIPTNSLRSRDGPFGLELA